ncbi:MAG: hypothetical protein CL824_02265 [Crocinitomicaceae bacterium]|nr:hypothetical protein [Crocinitomicaceae bacterium]
MNYQILDCTFRDGGYYNNWEYPLSLAKKYISVVSKTDIKFVELGFRSINKKNKGLFWYTDDNLLKKLFIPKNINLGVMINASDYIIQSKYGDIDKVNLKKNFYNKKHIYFVRIAFHLKEIKYALKISNILKSYGYFVGLNLMQISRLKIKEIEFASKLINKAKPDVFYIADSLGVINIKLLRKINKTIRKYWKGQLGIHAHDNLKFALKNTLEAKKLGFTWFDSTILGMGRGPGNVKTESLLQALNLKKGRKDLNKFIKRFFSKYLKIYNWGTNKYYKLSAKKNIHPTYVQEMLSDDRYKPKDIIFVLNKIKKSYFYNPNILNNFKNQILLNFNKNNFNKIKVKKDVLLIANTKDLNKNRKKIIQFIKLNNPTVLSINPNNKFFEKFVNYNVACNDIRIYADLKKYQYNKIKTIIPFRNIDKNLLSKLNIKKFINIECNFNNDDNYSFSNNKIVLPKKLSTALALAICEIKQVKNLFLAGFEGYKKNQKKRNEMNKIFIKFNNQKKFVKKIKPLTKTLYRLTK